MIRIKNVSFTYDNGTAGVHNLNLQIEKGECVLLCGGSGCGKTTVTRFINGLVPNYYEGKLEGEVIVDNLNVNQVQLYELAGKVGSVFQNPRSQFFTVDTTSELAFGCENIGLAVPEIKKRIEQTEETLELKKLMDRNIFMLSGGEKQKIACGSVMALEPEVYVFDEPSSNLDMAAISDLRRMIRLLKEQNKTIVIAEHRIFYLADLCDRVILMEDGRIVREISGKEFCALSNQSLNELGLRTNNLRSLRFVGQVPKLSGEKLRIDNFVYAYKNGTTALDISHLELLEGAVIALIGNNGAGKTTFSQLLAGLITDKKSTLTIRGKHLNSKKRLSKCYMVMQDVNYQLFTESVLEEVMLSQGENDEAAAIEILREMNLEKYKDCHPMSLSGGQKQRVAISSAFATECNVIIYDEPTSGLDYLHMKDVANSIQKLKKHGKTQIIVTHDPEFILSCCDYVIHLESGKVKEEYLLDEAGTEKMLAGFIQ